LRWNGATWDDLGYTHYPILAFRILPGGDLLAVGGFGAIGGVPLNRIGRWDGVQWHACGPGLDDEVSGVAILDDGALVVGGAFAMAGDVRVDCVARWDGDAWSPLDTGFNGIINAMLRLPNG